MTDQATSPTEASGSPLERRVRPQTHDYTRRAWGHDYSIVSLIEDGQRLRLAGWGSGIAAGDYLLLPSGSNTTRYQVTSIDYRRDPPDMWFADAAFAPRPAVSAA